MGVLTRFRWMLWILFALIMYPCTFLLTWLRQENCAGGEHFHVTPCTHYSYTEMALLSGVLTVVTTLVLIWRMTPAREKKR